VFDVELTAPQTGDFDEVMIESLISARAEARAARDFSRADSIRDELTAMGVEIVDTADGTTWRPAQP
jgi:cysteinyl-tRNA synthetase